MSQHAEKVIATIEAEDDASALTASWRRSANLHRLDPDRLAKPHRDIIGWRRACERDARLISIAKPYLDQIFLCLAGTQCGVYLADRTGMMIDQRTTRPTDSWNRHPDECLGTIYTEQLTGTNALGTCLAEERAVTLRGGEHFLAAYANLTCVAAPIFGPDGGLVAVLSITRNVVDCDSRIDGFLNMTAASHARRIEVELFAAAFPKARIVLYPPMRVEMNACLAVDADDCVIGATRTARKVLRLGGDQLGVVGFETLLDDDRTGALDLADAERRAIARALSRAGGNMSAAAKTMRISRSTLYRKILIYGLQRAVD